MGHPCQTARMVADELSTCIGYFIDYFGIDFRLPAIETDFAKEGQKYPAIYGEIEQMVENQISRPEKGSNHCIHDCPFTTLVCYFYDAIFLEL
jgi:hypothetical protein